MGDLTIGGSVVGSQLSDLLMATDIKPGDETGYQLAKAIYLYHPLGQKIAEAPISAAQSQRRELHVPGAPEEELLAAFNAEWDRLECDAKVFGQGVVSRVYGVSVLTVVCDKVPPNKPLPMDKLYDLDVYFNVLDPLNASGSFSAMADPNSTMFQRYSDVQVAGKAYHTSRCVTLSNEQPIYLAYESSAYGYVGRSAYQRALYPLKSFVQSMITDDLVTKKAGVLVATLRAAGSIVNGAMEAVMGFKRAIAKIAKTNDVISIDVGESIAGLDLTNVSGASETARHNILLNVAMASDVPAKWLNNETFAEGFGEGTEDAKAVARYVDRYRLKLNPVYSFLDQIVMRKAWTPAFYEIMQRKYPDQYGNVDYNTALYSWLNAWTAQWPSTLVEPDSEKIKVEDTKVKAVTAMITLLADKMDPDNRASLFEWAVNTINNNKLLFPDPIVLDIEQLCDWFHQQAEQAQVAADAAAEAKNEDTPKPRLEAA